jgi:clan AA aspartic protease (TIGR02281 family)
MKGAESRENGLVIVEADVSGEAFWFILDTGAMQTTVSREMVDALGLADKIGVETKLVLAGGKKIKGNRFEFPDITVAGQKEKDVTGVVVPVSEPGIDGLLGQSFLKRFVYTIDEDSRIKLRLRPRRRR